VNKLGEAIKYCTDKIAQQDEDSEKLFLIRELLYELDDFKTRRAREVMSWH
jgi:5-methylcytosine-specific restriction endonuclease McrBC regulatory subunit McrC